MAESAAWSRRGHKGAARATTLAGAINDAVLSISAADLSTWAGVTTNGPATATIDMGTTSEETIEFTGITGNTLTGVTRGVGGTTPRTHADNAPIVHSSQVRDYDEANRLVSILLGGVGTVTVVKATGHDHFFGAGAGGGAGAYVHLGSLGDPANTYVTAQGNVVDIGLTLRSKGISTIKMQQADGASLGEFLPRANFAADQTALTIVVHNGTYVGRNVQIGAADSAGVGFRTLRVAN